MLSGRTKTGSGIERFDHPLINSPRILIEPSSLLLCSARCRVAPIVFWVWKEYGEGGKHNTSKVRTNHLESTSSIVQNEHESRDIERADSSTTSYKTIYGAVRIHQKCETTSNRNVNALLLFVFDCFMVSSSTNRKHGHQGIHNKAFWRQYDSQLLNFLVPTKLSDIHWLYRVWLCM